MRDGTCGGACMRRIARLCAVAEWDDKDWYRSSRWNDEIEAAFETKLRRARTWSRAQYIRIQASHLIAQDDPALHEVGRTLLQRVIDEYGDSDQAPYAAEQLARSLATDRRASESFAAYQGVLDRVADSPSGRSGTSGITELALAELHLQRGTSEDLRKAGELLTAVGPEVHKQAFLRDRVLRFLTAQARLAFLLDEPSSGTYARMALHVADETEPGVPRHPAAGRPAADDSLRAELATISNASPDDVTLKNPYTVEGS